MTNKDIQNLIDKYLAGETSPAEERQLALALQQRQDLPEDWQAVSMMLGELTLGEAEYDAIMAQRKQKSSALIIALRTISTRSSFDSNRMKYLITISLISRLAAPSRMCTQAARQSNNSSVTPN